MEFQSLTFFKTHRELPNFTIANLKPGEQHEWDEGSPTFKQLIVRKRMGTNFNIFGESNDAAPKLKFKDNSNIEFTLSLPERFRLSDWQVCLK